MVSISNRLVTQFEKSLIMGGLQRAQGKRSRAATLLNINAPPSSKS